MIVLSMQRNSDANRKKSLHKLNNDNIDAAQQEANKIAKLRGARNRRLIAFFTLAILIIVFLGNTILGQNERLNEKQKNMVIVEKELQEIQEIQEMLKLQIAKLDDDDYIAKLARKEYFLSEEGEIIFTIPKEDSNKKDEE